jgi:hypothetical protein
MSWQWVSVNLDSILSELSLEKRVEQPQRKGVIAMRQAVDHVFAIT